MEELEWCKKNNFSLRQYWMEGYKRDIIGLDKIEVREEWLGKSKWEVLDKIDVIEKSFVFLIPSYNHIDYVWRNLSSVYRQEYINYRVIYIDDNSEDGTFGEVCRCVSNYGMWDRTIVYGSSVRHYASGSRYIGYHLCDDDEILCMLDGDDWLAGKDVLSILNQAYQGGCMTTYGSYCMWRGVLDKRVYGGERFPNDIIQTRGFRGYRWTSCHLRTGYAGLFRRLNIEDRLDKDGCFLRCCTDLCEMFGVLEMAGPAIQCIDKVLYIYNRQASEGYSNSYYNQKRFPLEKVYREYVLAKLQAIPKYPPISLYQLRRERNQLSTSPYKIEKGEDREWREKHLYLMNITGSDRLGVGYPIIRPIRIFGVWIGELNPQDIDKGECWIRRLDESPGVSRSHKYRVINIGS
jgi:glycosyltransferase involved in cell wall biosynthesis